MTEALLLALAIAAGAPVGPTALVATALGLPWAAMGVVAGLAGLALARRERPGDDGAEVLAAITAELRAGRSLRAALHAAWRPDGPFGRVGRRARLGVPIDVVVADLAVGLGAHGPLVAASLGLAERGGGAATTALETVGSLLRDDLALAAEVRAGAAPAKASIVAVVTAPILFVGLQSLDGSLAVALAAPGGVVLVVTGISLIGLGIAVALALTKGIR